MVNLGQLEPFALLTLAGGLLYSICVLTFESKAGTCYRVHFIILTLVIFLALLALSVLKYIKCRYACTQMNDFIWATCESKIGPLKSDPPRNKTPPSARSRRKVPL